jgi:hypothetical protein
MKQRAVTNGCKLLKIGLNKLLQRKKKLLLAQQATPQLHGAQKPLSS